MLEAFQFIWDTVASFLLLLRENLSFTFSDYFGQHTVSFFDIIFVLMIVYMIFKYFVFRH